MKIHHEEYIVYILYGMPKGMCPAEAMLNSEKIKPVALAVIKLRLSEGISLSVTQLVSRSLENSVE